jgi:DNA repair exonuclease SbcCD nuclease subunit
MRVVGIVNFMDSKGMTFLGGKMSKILLATDMHLDNWNYFSTVTKDGYNSRLIKQLEVLEQLLNYAREHNCYFVHGGDLWNRRLLIPSDVIHLTYKLLASYPKVTTYILIGNHDAYNWDSKCTPLSVLNGLKHVNVIDRPAEVYFQPNVTINFIPYGGLIPAIPTDRTDEMYSILLTHYGVNEAKLGPTGVRMESDLTVKQIQEFGYDLTLLGHIHKPQALADNIIVMGSAMAHSFHEVNEEKYFYVFDCESRELVKYPTNAPKFIVHNITSKEDLQFLPMLMVPDNYYRLNVWDSKITHEDMKPFVGDNVIISFAATSEYLQASSPTTETRTPQEEVEDYYSVLETDLDKKKLKKKAKEVIDSYGKS